MYTKVRIAGHPVHAMLVGFPVTLYVVAFTCFLAYALGAEPFWYRVGVYANLAGVILAAVAAIPGFIDWAFGIPTGNPAKSTGLVHMGTNIVALVLFGLNLGSVWSHRLDSVPPVGGSVALTALGVVFTLVAGFLGWRLVQKHHVGIDLSEEQQRLEPRVVPRAEPRGPEIGSHGHRVG
jgi:uncharacterized membrane protein